MYRSLKEKINEAWFAFSFELFGGDYYEFKRTVQKNIDEQPKHADKIKINSVSEKFAEHVDKLYKNIPQYKN